MTLVAVELEDKAAIDLINPMEYGYPVTTQGRFMYRRKFSNHWRHETPASIKARGKYGNH